MAAVNAGIDGKLFNYLVKSLQDTPYYRLLGLELLRLGSGISEFQLLTEEKHCNPLGLIHGGLIMSVADSVMANAIRSMGINGVTVDVSVSVISAVPYGSILRAIGKVRRAGRSMVFAEAEVWCGDRLVGQAKGTFYNKGPINY